MRDICNYQGETKVDLIAIVQVIKWLDSRIRNSPSTSLNVLCVTTIISLGCSLIAIGYYISFPCIFVVLVWLHFWYCKAVLCMEI